MSDRPFRRPESIFAEQITRRVVLRFLLERGFHIEDDRRERHGQTIIARSPEGMSIAMRVKLCWRRDSEGREGGILSSYSAAQLMARVENNDWIGSIKNKMAREAARDVTHMLFVQRDGADITHAALVPISAVAPIWTKQRDISEELIRRGRLGRRKKNHAMNGSSPTIWLQDNRGGQRVADALWKYPGVADLNELPVVTSVPLLPEEVAESATHVEGARKRISVNTYERDEKARLKCLEHHGTACVICGFDFGVVYGPVADGHIHVHHLRPLSEIGRSYKVDPVADLRPVCPNCHAVVHLNGGSRSIQEVKDMLRSTGHAPAED